ARARRDGGQARGRDPRRADDRRNSPGLRGGGVVRYRGAKGHAARDRRDAQRGGKRGARRFEARGAARKLGGVPMPMTPAQFGKLIADETEKWAKVVKFSGAKPD